jgi:hypothetical protein
VNVTDGKAIGYAFASYDTDPDELSFELFVEPSSGYALETLFMISVTN